MATPKSIKTVAAALVKNTLSPRNPSVFLEVPSPKFLSSPQKTERSPVSRKCLSFSEQQNRSTSVSIGSAGFIYHEDLKTDKKRSIIINTPTKSDLMENGFSGRGIMADILGRGSFGTVVKGFYGSCLVAVKITKGDKKNSPPSDSNAKGLQHENIVKILDIITKPEAEYSIVIMEYLEGAKNLQTVLDMSLALNKEIKKKFVEQICYALKYCHANGILHLDLKPKNILVMPNQQCKICDFGNSCMRENTKNYIYQGTIPYAAPELLRGMEPTEKCDIYSLGITIWQLEYEKTPFENWSSSKCLLYHVVKNNVRPEYRPKKDVFTKLFVSCWAENPLSRPELDGILDIIDCFENEEQL